MAQPKHDEFDRLLKCSIKELAAAILPMSAKECETYTRAMLDRIGGPSFDKLLMRIVETMVPEDMEAVHHAVRMNIIWQFGTCFPMCPQKTMLSREFWRSP